MPETGRLSEPQIEVIREKYKQLPTKPNGVAKYGSVADLATQFGITTDEIRRLTQDLRSNAPPYAILKGEL